MENSYLGTDDPMTTIAQARAAAADRLTTPWWYHPLLGLLVAGNLLGLTFGTGALRWVVTALFFGGLALLVTAYRRRTGVWISGFSAGAASRWAYALGALYGVALALSVLVYPATGLVWPTWALAVTVVVGTVLLGRRFDDALRAQLRAGS